MFRKNNKLIRPTILSASIAAALGTIVMVPAVYAQDELEEVIVTGSRIVQRDFSARSPVVTVESDLFENSSTLAVETVLNQLPQFVPAVTQFVTSEVQNSPTVTAGANTIDLRGLGSNRNLVLVDGRRAQPVNALLVVDTNTLPSSAIERVEVVTGGASATYGADAIAGVVNFILKKDYEGFEFDAQYGATADGDGEETRISGLFGANFDGGRGNVMLGVERANRRVASQVGREFYDNRNTDPTVAGTQSFATNTYYLGNGNNPAQATVDGIFNQSAAGSVPGNATFYVNKGDQTVYAGDDADGAYRYTDGLLNGLRKVRADGTIDENQPFSFVSTPLERYSIFARGRYEVSDSLEVYSQANFTQTKTNTLLSYSPAVTIWNASIPYGTDIYAPSVGNTAYQTGGAIGLDCAVTGCTNSEAFPVPADLATLLDSRANPNEPWALNRGMDYLGPRRTSNVSQTFQLLVGATGRIDAIDGSWDAYYSHGETDTTSRLGGFGDLQDYRNIVQSPNFGRGAAVRGPGGNGQGTGSCTTGLPIFGSFAVSEDCIAAVTANMTDLTYISQDIYEATIQGHLFDLPAGEVRFAGGASYRENEFKFDVSHLNSGGNSSSQAIGLFASATAVGATDATEIFGEVAIPVLTNAGFIQAFNLEIGARYSDYGDQGDFSTYKFLGDLSFNDNITLRGGWQRANRAPNIGELFAPESQTVEVTAYGDACATNSSAPWGANPGSNPNFGDAQALCSQLMGAVGSATYYTPPAQDGQGIFPFVVPTESGNTNLVSEEADTYTAGVVFQSTADHPLLSDISLSVDWYSIEIIDAIGPTGYDTIYEQCLSPSFNPGQSITNPFCQAITRDQQTGAQTQVKVSQANLGNFETDGVDVQVNWTAQLADLGLSDNAGGISVSVLANFLGTYKTQDLPSAPLLDAKGTGDEGGQFENRFFTTINYFNGAFSTSLRWRHFPGLDHASILTNPSTTTQGTNAYDIFDLNALYSFNETYGIRFGIDNLLDESPEIYGASPTTTAQGSTLAGYYDTLGRRYYVGFKASF